jgi:hypothetical protein
VFQGWFDFTTGLKPACGCFLLLRTCNILSDIFSFFPRPDLSWVPLFFTITEIRRLNLVILYRRCLTLQSGILIPRNMGLVPAPGMYRYLWNSLLQHRTESCNEIILSFIVLLINLLNLVLNRIQFMQLKDFINQP